MCSCASPRMLLPMSALGQKQTFAVQKNMSALLPKADMCGALAHVCFVPIADICNALAPRRLTANTVQNTSSCLGDALAGGANCVVEGYGAL
jgi:hypothetical protein